MSQTHRNQTTSSVRQSCRGVAAAWCLAALLGVGCGISGPGPQGPAGPQGPDGVPGPSGRSGVAKLYELNAPFANFMKATKTNSYYYKVINIPALNKNQAILGYVLLNNIWWNIPFNFYYDTSDTSVFNHLSQDIDQAGQLYLDVTNSKGLIPFTSDSVLSYRLYVLDAATAGALSQRVDLSDLSATEEELRSQLTK